jgi:hypothetical protein
MNSQDRGDDERLGVGFKLGHFGLVLSGGVLGFWFDLVKREIAGRVGKGGCIE